MIRPCRYLHLLVWLLAWLPAAACLPAAPASEEEDDALQHYLSRLGLTELRARHLERLLEREKLAPARLKRATELADAFADLLIDAAEASGPNYLALRARIDKLLKEIPAAKTPALNVVLLQADYQRAESLLAQWLEQPDDDRPREEALALLMATAPALVQQRKDLDAQVEKLAEQLEALKGARESTSLEQESARLQAASSKAEYFEGWANYYLGVARQEASVAEFTAARDAFLGVLDINDKDGFEGVEVEGLGLESIWRARSVLGLGLAETALGKLTEAERCFGWLEHASVAALLRDQAAYWRLQGLLNARKFAPAMELASRRIETFAGPPTPGKISFCVALLRTGAHLWNQKTAQESVGKKLLEQGVRGLARLRQFDTLSQLVAKYHLAEEAGDAASFYLTWLRGRRQFEAAEKSHAPADYQAASETLKIPLQSPEAKTDLLAAALCRYQLAWCQFRLGEHEPAAKSFREATPALRAGQSELAPQSAWMEFAAYQQLAEKTKDKKFNAAALAALRLVKHDFPGSEFAAKADVYLARLEQNTSPEAALAALEAVPASDPSFPTARLEIARIFFQRWNKVKADAGPAAPLAAQALAAVDRCLEALKEGFQLDDAADRQLKACLLALEILFHAPEPDQARIAEYLRIAGLVVERATGGDLPRAEYHFRRLQLAQLRNDSSTAQEAAQWISEHAASSPFEVSALIVVARQADAAVVAAEQSTRPEKQAAAAKVYARLAALVGETPEAIANVKNALAVNSKLAHYQESLGQWKAAAQRLDNIVAALPSEKKYLRRAGIAHFQAANYAAALEHWRKLLGGLEGGGDEWLEAKYFQLACLAKADRGKAREVYQQFQLLFPQVKSAAWKQKFADLAKEL